jgi:hypothetical protein
MEDGEDCHYPETREGGLYSPEGFQTDLVTPNYQQRPRGGRSSTDVLSHREIQPPSSEPFRWMSKEVSRAGAERLSGKDLPSVKKLQDLDSDLIRRKGSVQRRLFRGTSKETKRSKSTRASCPIDSRLLYRQESTSDSREVRVGSEEDRFPEDPLRITTISVAVYLV